MLIFHIVSEYVWNFWAIQRIFLHYFWLFFVVLEEENFWSTLFYFDIIITTASFFYLGFNTSIVKVC